MYQSGNQPFSSTGPIYTDRPSEKMCHLAQSWARSSGGQHHLNPSKSKINVKTFLNKTGDNFSLSHPNLENIRGSCYLGNPPKPGQSNGRDSFNQQKMGRVKRISQEVSTEVISKESFPKFTFTPASGSETDEKKRSDSTYLRSSLKEGFTPRNDEESSSKGKDEKAIMELRSQILSLTKKVFLNQEQISKLKEKKDKEKDKKWQSLEQEFTQFQIQMFDICKKNTNYFSEFESKIDKNNKIIAEFKNKFSQSNNKEKQKQDVLKRISQCQTRIVEVSQSLKARDERTIKNMATQINQEEQAMKKYVNDQVADLKTKIDRSWSDKTDILYKLDKVEKDLLDKKLEDFFKKDTRKAISSIVLDRKETISIKENDGRPKTNKSMTPRKQFGELSNKDFSQKEKTGSDYGSKKECLLKQSVYYIDSYGYLLDENRYYLLNSKNEQIMLPQKMLNTLKDNNMLVLPPSTYSAKR